MTEKQIMNKIEAETSSTINKEILTLMLENIGNINSELRDDVIFETFYTLFNENLLELEHKQYILNYVLSHDLLNYHIIDDIEDSVYTRSFTALLLVEILNDHYRNNWISKADERFLIQMSMVYLLTENNNSGKDPIKGWSHAFAHGADLLGAISKSQLFDKTDGVKSLRILDRILIDVEGFLYGEEGRLARATVVMFKENKINEDILSAWLQEKDEYIDNISSFKMCWKNYLMALSFTLKLEGLFSETVEHTIMHSLHHFFSRFKRL